MDGYLIEFRNGSFFQNLNADAGGPAKTAQHFASNAEAEEFMIKHEWIMFWGGMVVTAK